MTWLRRLSTRAPIAKGSARDPSATTSVRCPELSRLPKAPKIRSIRFKRTNPGSVSHLSFAPETTPVIDPSHPLARLRPQQLMRVVPHYHCSLFGAHAFPQGVLRQFEFPDQIIQLKDKGASNELADIIAGKKPSQSRGSENTTHPATVGDRRRAAHTVPMSLMIVTSKKPLHKSGVIRTKMKLRLKEALNLVVIRGASSHGPKESIMLTAPQGLHKQDGRTGIIVQGWTYVFRPSLEVYRCPWPSLLENLKEGLLKIQSQGIGLAEKWKRESGQRALPKDPPSQEKARSRQRSNTNSHVKRIHTGYSTTTPPEGNLEFPRGGA